MNPLISVVVTSYNRPDLLEQAVISLLETTSYQPLEMILADDASDPICRRRMQELPVDRFISADQNRGLGANTNSGLQAAQGDYVLQLQDDWVCTGRKGFLGDAVRVFEARPGVGLIKLTNRQKELQFIRQPVPGVGNVRIFDHVGEHEKWYYSDHPHIKSRAFIDAIGDYNESRYMQRTELDMRDRFLSQTRYSAAFMEDHDVFEHIGEEASHRSLMPLARIGQFMDRYPGLDVAARVYRKMKQVVRRFRQ